MNKTGEIPSNSSPKYLYRWTRDLHLYFGLFISPFLLIYAVSVFFLNHDWVPGSDAGAEKTSHTVTVPGEENSRELAHLIMQQLEITGELGTVRNNQTTNVLSFPLDIPGRNMMIRVDLDSGSAEVERQDTGVWDAMVYLHEMPGAHLVSIRGNWIFIRLWGWLADATAYLILFISASGVYLWSVLKAERKTGLIFLGAGVFSFFLIIVTMLE